MKKFIFLVMGMMILHEVCMVGGTCWSSTNSSAKPYAAPSVVVNVQEADDIGIETASLNFEEHAKTDLSKTEVPSDEEEKASHSQDEASLTSHSIDSNGDTVRSTRFSSDSDLKQSIEIVQWKAKTKDMAGNPRKNADVEAEDQRLQLHRKDVVERVFKQLFPMEDPRPIAECFAHNAKLTNIVMAYLDDNYSSTSVIDGALNKVSTKLQRKTRMLELFKSVGFALDQQDETYLEEQILTRLNKYFKELDIPSKHKDQVKAFAKNHKDKTLRMLSASQTIDFGRTAEPTKGKKALSSVAKSAIPVYAEILMLQDRKKAREQAKEQHVHGKKTARKRSSMVWNF